LLIGGPALAAFAQNSIPTFGTTVVDSLGLRGELYAIKPDSDSLPNFKHLKPFGVIYTTSLNVPTRNFKEGFPGITDRTEWFAIDYHGRFWVDRTQMFRFGLSSDDGSRLYIDNRLVIDNDGGHPTSGCIGQAELSSGVHDIRVSYFQGPRDFVALVLLVAHPGQPWQIFDTRNFKPPPDFTRTKAAIRKLRRGNCWAR
jgi:PA14 domain